MQCLGIVLMDGEGKIVEADETYIGGKEKHEDVNKGSIGGEGKVAVLALVEAAGRSHLFRLTTATSETLRPVIVAHVSPRWSLGRAFHVGKEYRRPHEAPHA